MFQHLDSSFQFYMSTEYFFWFFFKKRTTVRIVYCVTTCLYQDLPVQLTKNFKNRPDSASKKCIPQLFDKGTFYSSLTDQMKTSWFQNDQIRALTRVTSWNTGRPNDMSRARRASGRAAVPSLHGIELGQSGCHDDDGFVWRN